MRASKLLKKAIKHKDVGHADEVDWYKQDTGDGYGGFTYEDPVKIACRIDTGQTRIAQGGSLNERVSDTHILTVFEVCPGDKIGHDGWVREVVFSEPIHLAGEEIYREVSMSPDERN